MFMRFQCAVINWRFMGNLVQIYFRSVCEGCRHTRMTLYFRVHALTRTRFCLVKGGGGLGIGFRTEAVKFDELAARANGVQLPKRGVGTWN